MLTHLNTNATTEERVPSIMEKLDDHLKMEVVSKLLTDECYDYAEGNTFAKRLHKLARWRLVAPFLRIVVNNHRFRFWIGRRERLYELEQEALAEGIDDIHFSYVCAFNEIHGLRKDVRMNDDFFDRGFVRRIVRDYPMDAKFRPLPPFENLAIKPEVWNENAAFDAEPLPAFVQTREEVRGDRELEAFIHRRELGLLRTLKMKQWVLWSLKTLFVANYLHGAGVNMVDAVLLQEFRVVNQAISFAVGWCFFNFYEWVNDIGNIMEYCFRVLVNHMTPYHARVIVITTYLLLLTMLVYLVLKLRFKRVISGKEPQWVDGEVVERTILQDGVTTIKIRTQDGREFTLEESPNLVKKNVLEMSMPGSDESLSCYRPALAILMDYGGRMEVIGVGFRIRNYFCTAAHVVNSFHAQGKNLHIMPVIRIHAELTKIETTTSYMLPLAKLEANANKHDNVDLFAIALDDGVWANLRTPKISETGISRKKQQIATVGFSKDRLICAIGTTLNSSDFDELHYNSTTRGGWSGGPVFCGNKVVAMHVRSDGAYNIGIRIELIKRIIIGFEESRASKEDRDEYYEKFGGKDVIDGYNSLNEDVVMTIDGRVTYRQRNRDLDEGEQDYDDGYDSDEDKYDKKFSTKVTRAEREAYFENANPDCELVSVGSRVYCRNMTATTAEGIDLLNHFRDRIVQLGCDLTNPNYGLPIISYTNEENSLLAHLKLYEERVRRIEEPPTGDEIRRTVIFCLSN